MRLYLREGTHTVISLGLEFHEIPDAPVPAAGEAERLRQIRDLIKRFSASELLCETRSSSREQSQEIDHLAA